jgi:hypothetical protein
MSAGCRWDSHGTSPWKKQAQTGRFRPGKSGNQRATEGSEEPRNGHCQALLEGEAERIARSVVDKALAGDQRVSGFVLSVFTTAERAAYISGSPGDNVRYGRSWRDLGGIERRCFRRAVAE